MPFSTTYANHFLNFILAKHTENPLQRPAKVFLALTKNDPEKTGGSFTELSGDTYSRICISDYGKDYPDYIGTASDREIKNTKQINWTKAKQKWDAVNGFVLFDEEGKVIYYGKLDLTAKQIAAGGLICEKDAVMLFDPQKLKISFPTSDTVAGKMIYANTNLDDFVEAAEFNAYMYAQTPSPFSLEYNAAKPVWYTVEWDGAEYLCESKEGTLGEQVGIFIGNTKYSEVDGEGNPVDSLEPFMIGYDPASGQLLILADDDKTTHSVVIYKND